MWRICVHCELHFKLLQSGDHNLNIKHTYLNIKINNQGKTLHA